MRRDKTRLYAGVAAAVVFAAVGGFGIAKLTDRPAAPTPAAESKEKGEKEGAAKELALAPEAIRAAGIVVQPVVAGALADEVLAQGVVAAAPGGEAVLTARAAGAITRIYKRPGDAVRAGEPLAIVESREAAQITADRSVAQAKAGLAEKSLARERRLFEQGVSARQDYEQAQAEAAAAAAEARRARAASGAANVTSDGRGVVVASPIAGRVTAASASLGAFVQPETELFRIADPGRVQVEASVSGLDATRVKPGDRAIVETPDGRSLEGHVRSITPGLSQQTRAATAVIEVAPTGLPPGSAVRVRIGAAGVSDGGIVVPDEAVQSVAGHDVVFIRTAKGFQVRPVMVGQRSAGLTEIATGLKPGEVIATRNAFLLKAELSKGEGEEDE